MSNNQTLTFETKGGSKPVKWKVFTATQMQQNLLVYRLIGLASVLDSTELGSLMVQALAVAGAGGKYQLQLEPEAGTTNEYGKWVSLGFRVYEETSDTEHEVVVQLMFPAGWQVLVDGRGYHPDTTELAADFYTALGLTVVDEINAAQLPPVEGAYVAPQSFPRDESGAPVVMPAAMPEGGDRLLTQEEAEALRTAQKKAEAEQMGFTVDPE